MKEAFFRLKCQIARKRVRFTLASLIDIEETDGATLQAINVKRRTKMVLHAFDTTDYYQETYRSAGFRRADLAQPQNFSHLPLLTRADVRENFKALVSSHFNPSTIGVASTGGSTGIPLQIGTDPRHALEVISWRRLRYWGSSPGHNSGYIYRVIPSGLGAIARQLLFYPTRRSYLRATDMSEKNLAHFVTKIKKSRAIYLVAYVGALKILADYVVAHRIQLPELKFIWSTAAPLPVYLQKELQAVFKVPVYSQYGSAEFYWIASERKDRKGLDVDWDIRNVEILDERGIILPHGNFGDIVVSDFLNKAFPLLRYQIGDRGRFLPQETPSGPGFPILDQVKGRSSETLQMRDGRRVPGEFWTTVFNACPDAVSGFSIHQRKDGSIIVGYNPTEKWSPEVERSIYKAIREVCADTPFELKPETSVTHDRGKLNYVTSAL